MKTSLQAAGVVLLLLLVVAGTGWALTGHEPSELAGWIEAVATALALLAAMIAAIFAVGAFRIETARERRWEDSAARAQAEVVAAWGHRGEVIIVNGSALPVYDVQLVVLIRGKSVAMKLNHLQPTDVGGRKVRETVFLKHFDTQYRAADAAGEGMPSTLVVIEFSDAAGQRWLRDARGRLSRL